MTFGQEVPLSSRYFKTPQKSPEPSKSAQSPADSKESSRADVSKLNVSKRTRARACRKGALAKLVEYDQGACCAVAQRKRDLVQVDHESRLNLEWHDRIVPGRSSAGERVPWRQTLVSGYA